MECRPQPLARRRRGTLRRHRPRRPTTHQCTPAGQHRARRCGRGKQRRRVRRQRIPLQRPVAQLSRRAARPVPFRCRQFAAENSATRSTASPRTRAAWLTSRSRRWSSMRATAPASTPTTRAAPPIAVDPASGDPAERSIRWSARKGAELGARIHFSDRLQATLAVWTLKLDSELLFVGDAGATEASRPSRRDGVELGVYWFPSERFTANLEASYTDAYFDDDDPPAKRSPARFRSCRRGRHVPWRQRLARERAGQAFRQIPADRGRQRRVRGSTSSTCAWAREWSKWGCTWTCSTRWTVRPTTSTTTMRRACRAKRHEGVEDIHFHVFPSRSLRASLRYSF